jgi:uncharacterized membrane protein
MLNRRLSPILLILLLALALRLINLGGRSLWYDEAFAVLFAEKGLGAMLYGTLTPVAGGAADIHPLLYYMTLDGWMRIFGESPFAVRLWSVLLGLATVYVVYLLARDLFDEKTGLAAALITAIAPFHVQYSQETRMYSLMALLLAGATWCFVRAWRRSAEEQKDNTKAQRREGRKVFVFSLIAYRYWIFFGILAGLAMYAQQLAAFYLVALGLVLLLARRREQIGGLMLGVAVALIVYAPWLVNLPGQLNKVGSYYWIPQPTLAQFFVTVRSFLAAYLQYPPPASLIAFALASIVVVFLPIQVVFYLRRPRRKSESDRDSLMFVLWLFATPVALMWLVSQVRPVYLDRALLGSALMLYIALAWLFTRSGIPRPVAVVIGGMGLILVGIGLYYQYTWNSFPNSPFPDALASIKADWQSGDVIVHQNKLSALPMIYYERDLPQRYLRDLPGSSEDTLALPTQQVLNLLAEVCVQAASRDGQRIWFVMFADAPRQYKVSGRTDLQDAFDWLNAHYTQAEVRYFNDLDIYLFANRATGASSQCP